MFESLETRQLLAFTNWGAADQLIKLPDALQAYHNAGITLDGTGQTIAVIDSGIDYTIPELGGGFGLGHKVIAGYDFVDDDADPLDSAQSGHGTEVASVAAADPYIDNGIIHQGVASNAKLVALRVYDGVNPVADARMAQAFQWVIDHRVQYSITVVNVSFGQGSFNRPTVSTVYGDELQQLRDDGVSVVASAGNFGVQLNRGINLPAADPGVISVGSVGTDDIISSFSDRGSILTMLAPGEDVETIVIGGGHALDTGTSFAAPIVAGTIALMRQLDPTLLPGDVRSILRASATQNFDGDGEIGNTTRLIYPRLNLLNAVNLTTARKSPLGGPPANLGKFGNGNGIAVDADGVTHLVYYDSSARTMKYATRSLSGQWSALQEVDNSLQFQGYYLSLALTPQGQPTVAYFDGTNGDLKFAAFTGTAWLRQTIDVKNSTGAYPSMVYDRNGLALIAYYRKTTGDLRVARRSFRGVWQYAAVDSEDDVGRYASAAVAADGRIGIAYQNTDSGELKYAIMNPRTGLFSKTTVDNTARGASFISTAFSTADDNPWISYYDSRPADLRVAQFRNHRWTPLRLASRGATGLFTNLFFAGDDQANIVYYDKRHDALSQATLNNGVWEYTTLQLHGGRDASVALDPLDGIFRYTYYDSRTGFIKTAEQNI